MIRALSAFSLFALIVTPALAQTAKQSVKFDFEILQDRTVVYTQHIETTPLNPASVQSYAQYRTLIRGNQTFEIVEAYTRKVDGRIIPVDQTQIAVQDGSVGPYSSLMDVKIQQIPFRELGIGDTSVLTLRFSEKDHYIPGNFSWAYALPFSGVMYDLDTTVRSPASVTIRHSEHDLTYEEVLNGETRTQHWSGKAFSPPPLEKNIANYLSLVPSLQFTTFANYESIAEAFFKTAAPKALVTPSIQKLADEITAGREGSRAQAEAIFEWVSKNIRYVAVFLGTGRYIPNDAETVMARRFGDCKDHVTLMSALLAARNIESELVLINSGSDRELYAAPVLQAFDHVILYLPAFDIYADPTAPTSTLSALNRALADKPVVRVSAKGAILARTPAGGPGQNTAKVDTHITLDAKGIPRAETVMEATGDDAQILREFVYRSEATGQQEQMDRLAKALGLTGSITMSAPMSLDHTEPYRIKLNWTGEKPLKLGDPHWIAMWHMSLISADPVWFFGHLDAGSGKFAVECRAGRIAETISVQLPKGVSLKPVPNRFNERTPIYSLTRQWSFTGTALVIKTDLVSNAGSRVCSADSIKQIVSAHEKAKAARSPNLRFVRLVQPAASAQIERLTNPNRGSLLGRSLFSR